MPQPDPGEATTTLLRTAYNAVSAAIYRHVAEAAGAGLRPAHGNALEMLALEDGLRLTDIAAQASSSTTWCPRATCAARKTLPTAGPSASTSPARAARPPTPATPPPATPNNNSRRPSGRANTSSCAATWQPSPASAREPRPGKPAGRPVPAGS